MSSTISPTEVQQLPVMLLVDRFKQDKSSKLVRTSSIEKFRRFNTYLCTQHYYIVPAILAWLKSSQDVLHSSAEKTILFLRSFLFNTIIYGIAHLTYRTLSFELLKGSFELLISSIDSLKQYAHEVYHNNQLENKILKVLVYLAALILFSQLGLCLFVVFSAQLPYGLTFLFVCLCYIHVFYLRATFFFMANKSKNNRISRKLK